MPLLPHFKPLIVIVFPFYSKETSYRFSDDFRNNKSYIIYLVSLRVAKREFETFGLSS